MPDDATADRCFTTHHSPSRSLSVECRGGTNSSAPATPRDGPAGWTAEPSRELTLLVEPSGAARPRSFPSSPAALPDGRVGRSAGAKPDDPARPTMVEFRGRNIGFVFQQYHLFAALNRPPKRRRSTSIAAGPAERQWAKPKEVLARLGMV